MNLRNYINVTPTTLTIAPTYRCTAACKECCFRCTPKVERILETEKILLYIDEAAKTFPTIKLMVLTGGECFLVAKDIPQMISCAKSHGMMSRVVSNGFWATSYEAAIKKLTPIVEAGLTELNISTGDNHQEYVPFENVINAIKAAYDLGIVSMAVYVESSPNADFTSDVIRKHSLLSPLIKKGVLHIIDAAWMQFSTTDNMRCNTKSLILENFETHRPCKQLYDNIIINPYSQMLACCGLTVEYNKYLKLGEIGNDNSILDLYNSQFTDMFKFWLHVDGPALIYDKITKIRGIEKKTFPHECQYCIELIHDKENLKLIKTLFEEEFSNILFRYSVRNTSLNFNKYL